MGDRRVEQHAVDTQFHRRGHVAGCAHARIHDDRIVGITLLQILHADPQIVGVEDALPGADRAARRHDAGSPQILEAFCHDRIVAGVDEHGESLPHQPLGGLERADGIGQERPLVAEDLELHPLGTGVAQFAEQLAAEPGDANRIVSGVAAGGVWQQHVARRVDMVENVFAGGIDEPFAPYRHGDTIRAGGLEARLHLGMARIFARAHDQPAGQGHPTNTQRLIGCGEGGCGGGWHGGRLGHGVDAWGEMEERGRAAVSHRPRASPVRGGRRAGVYSLQAAHAAPPLH